jgi:hypothetical protein
MVIYYTYLPGPCIAFSVPCMHEKASSRVLEYRIKEVKKKAWDEVGYIAEDVCRNAREHMDASFFATNKAAMIMLVAEASAFPPPFLSIRDDDHLMIPCNYMIVDGIVAFSTGGFLDLCMP